MQIVYDELKEKHLDSLTSLDNICFSVPWSKNLFAGELLNEKAYYIVALCGDEVVGYGGMNFVLDEGSITNIAVHPLYRNQRIASCILSKLIDCCVVRDLSVLMLELRESNKKALSLYEKFGFETVGMRKNYYSDNGENAILMTKHIR